MAKRHHNGLAPRFKRFLNAHLRARGSEIVPVRSPSVIALRRPDLA
jgi:hypothetical protein